MASSKVDETKEYAADSQEIESREQGELNVNPEAWTASALRVPRRSTWGMGLKIHLTFV